jgi:flagellar basal-body rod modification protein FlgD
MENAEFIAQMAQFSTVTGITEISESLKGMSEQLSEFRIATAANMLGHSVLVPGSDAYPDTNGTVAGAVDLPESSANTNIMFRSETGEILHTQELGAQAAGLVGFSWDDIPQNVLEANKHIKVEAYADTGTGLKSVGSSVYGEVLAASTGSAATDVVYEVRGYGDLKASDVVRFKN